MSIEIRPTFQCRVPDFRRSRWLLFLPESHETNSRVGTPVQINFGVPRDVESRTRLASLLQGGSVWSLEHPSEVACDRTGGVLAMPRQSDGDAEQLSLIDLPAAAKKLGTSERHLRRLVGDGRIPYTKLGKGRSARLRFRVDRLALWVDEHSYEPESEASA